MSDQAMKSYRRMFNKVEAAFTAMLEKKSMTIEEYAANAEISVDIAEYDLVCTAESTYKSRFAVYNLTEWTILLQEDLAQRFIKGFNATENEYIDYYVSFAKLDEFYNVQLSISDRLNLPIDYLNLDRRDYINAYNAGFTTIYMLINRSTTDLESFSNMGKHRVRKISQNISRWCRVNDINFNNYRLRQNTGVYYAS